MPVPAPVDPSSDEWEKGDGAERKNWIDAMHGSAPGVDWRAIERARDREERERRALAGQLLAPGTWAEVGSRNQSGQTRCAALAPDGSLLLGSANGGLWRGSLSGQEWRPLSDDLGGGVDQVLAFLEDDAEVLLIRRGVDVFRSDDDGVHWEPARGLGNLVSARRWVRTSDGEILLLATVAGSSEPKSTLLASRDGGRSFQSRWTGARAWDGDLAWAEDSGALWLLHEDQLLRSLDQGASFEVQSTISEAGDEGRLALAGSPVERVFVLIGHDEDFELLSIERNGELRDLGQMSACFGTVATLPGDEKTVFVGGVELWRSARAGLELKLVNPWTDYYLDPLHALHADVRGFDSLRADNGDVLALAHTDGGTYLSVDAGMTWRNLCLEGLGVGQVYDTLSDRHDPRRVAIGTQDQGFQTGLVEASASTQGPARSGPLTATVQLISGDYGYLDSSDGSHERVFASYPDFLLIATGEGSGNLERSSWPRSAKHAWMPPVVADPAQADACFLLADRLYRFTPSRTERYRSRIFGDGRFDQGEAQYLTAMAFSKGNPDWVVAADDAGGRHLSRDGGRSWLPSEDDGAGAEGFRPSVLVAHPTRASVFVVGGAGYGGAAVRLSEDGGRTWVPLAQGLGPTLVTGLAWWDDDTLYAASEAGPWRWRGATGVWEPIAGGQAPNTTYWSVECLPSAGLVRFGTYGRGVWDFRPERSSRRPSGL